MKRVGSVILRVQVTRFFIMVVWTVVAGATLGATGRVADGRPYEGRVAAWPARQLAIVDGISQYC